MHLIADCRAKWAKFYSNRVAMAWGLVLTGLWAFPDVLNSILQQLPAPMQAVLGPTAIWAVVGLQVFVRMVHQPAVASTPAPPPPE